MRALGALALVAIAVGAAGSIAPLGCGGDDASDGDVGGGAGDDDGAASSDAPIATGDGAPLADGGGGDARPLGAPKVYVGSSDGKIRVFDFDVATAALAPTPLDTTPAGKNPSFLAPTPDARFLYAIDETSSQVLAFGIDGATGKLSSLGAPVGSAGGGPAYVGLDRDARFVVVANYGGGTIGVFPRGADGRLGAPSATVSFGGGAKSHEIVADPSNAFLLVPNLGLDAVSVLALAPDGAVADAGSAPAGDGPRHLAFDSTGHRAYVVDELASAVVVFGFDPATGVLSQLQTLSTLPNGFTGMNTGAEIQLGPDGRHVYVSNRGDDSIVVFDVSASDGKLSGMKRVATGGKTPRHFRIEETGRFLLVGNQDSSTVVVMRIDASSGVPSPIGSPLPLPSPEWIGLVYLPSP